MGSSSSICSLLAATTLGVIVPDRDEKKGGWGVGVEDDMEGEKGRGSKAWNMRLEKLKLKTERCVNLMK